MQKSSLWFVFLSLLMVLGGCHVKKAPSSSGDINPSSPIKGLKTAYFDFDQSEIRQDQTVTLQANADFLKSNSGVKTVVEGNCDERGTNEYNLALGDRRARTTKNYIVNLGVDPDRMNTISYGEERPVATCHDESCWWQNRRADFTK